jgi:hypothetical protein
VAYSFKRTITVDHTQVGGTDSTNFPLAVAGTYADLKTVGNGGSVQNGRAVVQVEKALGARPIAVVSTPEEARKAATDNPSTVIDLSIQSLTDVARTAAKTPPQNRDSTGTPSELAHFVKMSDD